MIYNSTTHARDPKSLTFLADLAWLQYSVLHRTIHNTTISLGMYFSDYGFTFLLYWLVII
jgi:hypothetical protein